MSVSRRQLLIGTAVLAGGGLAVAWLRPGAGRPLAGTGLEPNAWLALHADGRIVVQVDKAELGQGVMTAYVTLVAEELDVPPSWITPESAPVHPLFQDPVQITGESQSVIRRWTPLRRTGATARALLIEAAGVRWGLPPDALRTDGGGRVIEPATGRALAYAELVEEAARLPVPREVPLRESGTLRWIGGEVQRPDVPAKVRGTALYGIDTRLPGQLTAVIRRPPRLRAAPQSWDDQAARGLPGVHDVVGLHSGVAVLADTFWHAARGVAALDVQWSSGSLEGLDLVKVRELQSEALDTKRGLRARRDGNLDRALTEASRGFAAEYTTPYLTHATLEPMNATVWFHDGRCEAWLPSQAPDMARQVICDMSGLPRERVTVHTPFSGGGFGRRASLDWVVEAVAIALQSDRPVRLVWTREDDQCHGLFRQATMHRMTAALDERGRPAGWRHRMALAAIIDQILPPALSTLVPEWIPRSVVRGAGSLGVSASKRIVGPFQARYGSVDMPYAVDHVSVEMVTVDPGVPLTIWRSVGSSYNAFVVESFIDELAHAAATDPAEFRRELLVGKPRHLAVLERVTAEAGWGHPQPGRFQGLALHESFGAIVGQIAEVRLADGGFRVERVICVIDCGSVVNPDIVRQQMEGGIIFGLTAALHGEITLRDGAVQERNFDAYRMLRLADSPEIEVRIIENSEPPGGVGEPGTPPIAPAVANALFAATGQRLRNLPLKL
ncbi:MAG: xanthine dehydrogenase family protein molybdopterin-binding subunit [Chromatiales bacterium]|nr:xanthine dehydrogenase family protein molybdopterin-binding subunit [Chromatiales bacterium]